MLAGYFRNMLLLLLLTVVALMSVAQTQRQASEPELKAAILINMLAFVDWPTQGAQPAGQRKVCYITTSPVAIGLVQINGQLQSGKPLQIVQVAVDALAGCHALYVSPNESAYMPRILSQTRQEGVLLVGDQPGTLQGGVMINLEVDNGRVVFTVDLRALRQAGLTLSSKVLRLARQVLE